MKKKIIKIDEETFEITEMYVDVEEEDVKDEAVGDVISDFAEALRKAMGCTSDEFYDKYRAMKKEQQIQELTKATEGISGVKTKLEEKIENEEKIDEAIAALQVLGYNKREIEKAFDKLVKENMTTEELIRKGLSILGK